MPFTLRPPTRQPQWNLTILCVFFIWQFLVTLYTLWFNIANLMDLLFDSFNHPRGPGVITPPGGRGQGAFLYASHYFILCEYHESPTNSKMLIHLNSVALLPCGLLWTFAFSGQSSLRSRNAGIRGSQCRFIWSYKLLKRYTWLQYLYFM
jgi:hypothetical protein